MSPAITPPELSISTVDLAISSLLRWLSAHRSDPDDDPLIHVVLSLPSPPPLPHKRRLLPLPHPLHPLSPSTPTCLIVDDRPGSPFTPSSAAAKLSSDSIPISTVLGLSSFSSDHKSFDSRKKLFKSHPVFFVDSRVLKVLQKAIGKPLWGKGTRILVVNLESGKWGEQMRKACESACFRFANAGSCTVAVGRASMGREKLVENVAAVAGRVVENWGDVRGVYVKSGESVALPVYRRDGEELEVRTGDENRKEEKKKKKRKVL